MSKKWEGIFAALTTPFEGEKVATGKLAENIRRYNRTGLAGYVILGSTGEAVFLGDRESDLVVASAKAAADPKKKIIVGTSRESTRLTLAFTNRMARLAADAALVKPPYYYRSLMSQDILKRHYLEVAEHSRIPILIYNIPQNTGVAVEPSTVSELSRHPNIAGIKDSSGVLANLTEVLPAVRPSFSFLLGAGSIMLAGLMLGAQGGILALAAAVPDLCVRLYNLFCTGEIAAARQLQLDLVPLNKALTQTMGIPAIKWTLDRLGYCGGRPRAPLVPLEKEKQDMVSALLEKLGVLETPGRSGKKGG
ncbi:MAG: dihydrodipicolinate synthase family protein [Acidobacteriota bacterium]